ncbi:cation:proton antiporter [Amaricoccus solimangrovi]|uniref:Sodium:proton antiporter n=1 Tax=Amaricoccus solimangrovi TaxID=2589815 RepID=A0A501WND7_9RHOB|nr:sodium:proton antiporter [Amaricoccus solimangrovi]TPE50949.1 sodium:proton antiporter [Amaricoccus solimangrovi]
MDALLDLDPLTEFNIAIALSAGVVLVLGLFAGYVKNRLWMSEPTLCLLLGVLAGPAVLGLADPARLPVEPRDALLEVARMTLAIAVMGAALRLPAGYVRRNLAPLLLVLGPGLLVMWLASAGLAAVFLGASPLVALLLGAILAPTDPVVAGSITTGKIAEHLPARIRRLLIAESGANDGLGLLFVMLPLLLLTEPPGAAVTEWLTRVLLWEIGGAVVIGAAAGWLAGRLLLWAYRQPFSDDHSLITVGLALSLTVLALVRLMGGDGILAVFAAGVTFARYVSRRETRHEHAQEAIGRFFDLPAFILIGVALPWGDWAALGWAAPAFAAAVLALRRLPWWMLGRVVAPEFGTRAEFAFMGWFGPIGVSSTYYALLAARETGVAELWPWTSLVVFASVLVHGITATPLTRLVTGIGRGEPGLPREPA